MIKNKICSKCEQEFPATKEFFYARKNRPDGLRYECKACSDTYNTLYKNEHKTEISLRNKRSNIKSYGITLTEYRKMFKKSKGMCAICGRKAVLNIDHCHNSGKVRGLLCSKCNFGLGQFDDDPKLLQQAVKYLEKNYRRLACQN